jgi:translocation and assembly module TamA
MLLAISAHSVGVELTINGIKSNEIKENVQLFVMQADSPISEFDVDDYEQKITAKVDKALQAFGYYNADIKITPFAFQANGNFPLEINISLNDITIVNRVILQADYMNDAASVVKDMPPKLLNVIEQIRAMQGKPLNHVRYETLKNQLSTFALLYGYFDFKFLLHKLLITPTDNPKVSNAIVHWLFT